jgi:hypothetical protein
MIGNCHQSSSFWLIKILGSDGKAQFPVCHIVVQKCTIDLRKVDD